MVTEESAAETEAVNARANKRTRDLSIVENILQKSHR
jgi:hypothetical protein